MAYIFDPIQGTFIDDKDKTLGNKLMITDLVDDLEPGPLKDEMLKDFDPDQETYEEYLQRKRLGDRPFLMADGGRVNLNTGSGLPLDPMDIDNKLQEVINAFKKLSPRSQNRIGFQRFFEIYAKENFATGGRVNFSEGLSPALKKLFYNTPTDRQLRYKGIMYLPTTNEFKVRKYQRGQPEKDVRFKVADYKNVDEAFKAAEKFKLETQTGPEAKKLRSEKARKLITDRNNLFAKNANEWTIDWLNRNAENYEINQVDKALKQLINDWKKSDLALNPGTTKSVFLTDPKGKKTGFPNVRTQSKNPNFLFTINDVPPLTNKQVSPRNHFTSLFYGQKLSENPELKRVMSDYLDYVVMNKKNQKINATKYADTLNNPLLSQVKNLLENNRLKGSGQDRFFSSQFDNYKKYKQKFRTDSYVRDVKKIEKTLGKKKIKEITGTDGILKFMNKERIALKKIFDYTPLNKLFKVKNINNSLAYSTEHVLGISNIAKMKNKKEMAKSLNMITGMTAKRNAQLGRQTFNTVRSRLINNIDTSKDPKIKKDNLDKLNKLIAENTDIKGKAGAIVNGKFKYNDSIFKQNQSQKKRFFNYFKEIYNIPEGRAEMLKQSTNNPQLAKIVSVLESNKKGGVYSFPAQLENIEVPNSVSRALNVAGKVVKAAGKATGIAEPAFALYNLSEAVDKGASVGQSAEYVVGKFFEDVVNLPGLAYGGAKYAKQKLSGEDAKFELPYEATFARDKLQTTIDQTDPEVIQARLAQRDFDTQILPSLAMVDDMEIPASKEEIDAAQDRFMEERGIDLSVLDNIDEEKTGLPPIIKSLVAPDQTFNQFLADGGRVGFSNGGAAGADESFAKELEYYFLNEDAELPQAQSFKETMNPIEILNDMIDPRNLPYYADVLLRSGVRVGEFAGRILPAAGRLASDLIRRPVFKVTGDGGNYVQDYDEVPETNIKGTGIFTEFLENITPTATEKAIGLESLIQTEEQKLKDRRSTIGPKVFADTFGLGLELTAPIFPGLKLLNAYAAAKKLPKDRVTEELLNKEIDQVLAQKGMTRREFLQMSGAGATVALAKMLGIVDFFPKAGKVSRAASKMAMDTQVTGMPAWFKDAVYAIEKKGILKSRGDIKGVEPDFFEMTLNTKAGNKKVLMSKNDNTGEITIDWTTNYYDTEIPVSITYRPGESGYQNLLSDPDFPQSVERYNVEVEAPEFEYKTVDVESMGPEDTSFDSAINLDIREEADAVVEALEELGLTLTKGQKKEAAENFRYYNEVELDEGSGANTQNPLDENDVFTLMDTIKRNQK